VGEDRPRRRAEGRGLSAPTQHPAEAGAAADPAAPVGPGGGPWRNFYGRRHGKTLRARQQALLADALARRAVPGVDPDANPERTPLDLRALFPGASDLWLEVGFGGGEHLIATAEAHPRVALIGCEPFVNGVAMCLSALEGRALPNLRLHAGDARFLLDVLPPASLGRAYLLYPDPWPKRRHHERRFFGDANLDALARALRPGAELRLATDVPDYVRHARAVAAARPDFACLTPPDAEAAAWEGWPGTRYEAKALREGRAPAYLRFRRL
jgi:tRNA (guanine-N7-)-methyltransferase